MLPWWFQSPSLDDNPLLSARQKRIAISPAVAAAVAALPPAFHRDPADRIIVRS